MTVQPDGNGMCESCPGRKSGRDFRLISDHIQFHAARQAAAYAIENDPEESPEEAAESLARYRLDDIIHGRQGSYEVAKDEASLNAGVECARRLLNGECQLDDLTWRQATADGDPTGRY